MWKTYSESQKVHWKDCAKDAAERHAEIFPGYRYQHRTHDENVQTQEGEDASKAKGILKKPYRRVSKKPPPFECATIGNKYSVPPTSAHNVAPPMYYAPSLLLEQDDDAYLVPDSVSEIVIEGLSFDDMWGYNDVGVGLDSFGSALKTLAGI